jgi:hypothetical protein
MQRDRLQKAKGVEVIPFHTTIPMVSQGWIEGVKYVEEYL